MRVVWKRDLVLIDQGGNLGLLADYAGDRGLVECLVDGAQGLRAAFMRILVTGGSGFIGSRLIRGLCDTGYEVRVVSRKKYIAQNFSAGMIESVQADLLDPDLPLEQVISGCSVVFNCAGELRNESLMGPLHVDATDRLIRACKSLAKTSGQPIHWVQLSSVGAYGQSVGNASAVRVVTEKTSSAPVGAYEITKTKADELVVSAAEEGVFSYSILRPSNVYGAGMPNASLRQWGRMIGKKLFFYIGAPGAVSTYVHVEDVVAAMMLCGFDERAKGEIFNISNDCPQEQLVSAMAKALGVAAPSLRVPEWLMRLFALIFSGVRSFPISDSKISSLVARTSYPSSKLEAILGYRPTHDVRETIGEIFLEDGDLR